MAHSRTQRPSGRPSRPPASGVSPAPNSREIPRDSTPPILPIAERLNADDRFSGRGVTIAFLDSGFYAHPDLITPRNRIVAYNDALSHRTWRNTMPEPDASSWHGMMTSVVCAGNGALSDGRYKGLAHEADLVLVKVGSMSRVRHDDIRAGLQWVLANHRKFDIRVVNISAGGDYEASYLTDALSQAAEECVRAGIVVICAAGNTAHSPVLPPASAPSVLSIGGFDDNHNAQPGARGLYHSSFGPTIDGLQKPEVIAPAIWVAAPILPGTPTAAQASLLDALAAANDEQIQRVLDEHRGVDPELDAARARAPYHLRNIVALKRRSEKLVSAHYKHVDGTSFAAPIVTSIVAQMLEANPTLTPMQVKRILIDTATRLPEIDSDRQGWGVVQPRTAILRALEKKV
ncbi:MAG: S8 family serine peptidase [Deltaproteobacteria bacterium]|nr:S8 family serine peptidase [Deltaproteobacteria bacterium]